MKEEDFEGLDIFEALALKGTGGMTSKEFRQYARQNKFNDGMY